MVAPVASAPGRAQDEHGPRRQHHLGHVRRKRRHAREHPQDRRLVRQRTTRRPRACLTTKVGPELVVARNTQFRREASTTRKSSSITACGLTTLSERR